MSKRILVVEDQPDNRQIIRDMLAPTDYEITEVESGEEALDGNRKAAARSHPDGYPIADHGRLYGHEHRSRPIPHCDRSRSLRSPHMRLAGRRRKRGQPAAMIMFRSPLAHVSCWRKSGNTCPKLGINCCSA